MLDVAARAKAERLRQRERQSKWLCSLHDNLNSIQCTEASAFGRTRDTIFIIDVMMMINRDFVTLVALGMAVC